MPKWRIAHRPGTVGPFMESIQLTLNGETVVEDSVSPTTTLLNYARARGLTGTKEGCAEGDCGACTMAVIDPETRTFRAVNSCLVLLPMMQGKQVYTVEALKQGDVHHPAQEKLVQALGSQCGYCTPGIVMSMFEACYRSDMKEEWQLDDQLAGNLCRCTGYRPIRDAARAVAGTRPADDFIQALDRAEARPMNLSYRHEDQRFFVPDRLETLWDVLDQNDDARFVVGGTDLSLEITKRFESPPCLVSLEGLPSLRTIEQKPDAWRIGAAVSVAELETACAETFPSIERMVRFYGARQIKNRATIGGNLCTASPIGDLPPILIALGARVELASRSGTRTMRLEDFFVGYRKTALEKNEILAAIEVPISPKTAKVTAYKVSKRQELDISTVSAGLYVEVEDDRVVTARFAFGGMAAKPARAPTVEAQVVGQPFVPETFEAARAAIDEDFTPIDDHRGSAWYRKTVVKNLLVGFVHEARQNPALRLASRPTGTVHPEVTT